MWSWLCCSSTPKEQPKRPSQKLLIKKDSKSKDSNNLIKTNQPEILKTEASNTVANQQKINNNNTTQQIIEKKDIYNGEELNGLPHGTGTMNFVNGDYYKGEWVSGVKEGKGEHYYFQLRTIYNGQWKHDMKNGIGHETQANGSWYEGEFRDGVRHGKGIYFDKEMNTKFSQIYVNGKIKERKEIGGSQLMIHEDQFPTLKLDKQRFNSTDLIRFQQKNPQIKQLDLEFLLKYYGLCKVIHLQFIDTPISEWTIKQVHQFLEQIQLQQYKTIFYDNKIKGKDLASLDQSEMKDDLKMKLGDRKILISYVDYLNSLCKNKKKQSNKEEKKNIEKRRRESINLKKKKENLLNTITRSMEHEIIEQDDEWNEGYSDDQMKKSRQKVTDQKITMQKVKNQYETQNWDKFISRDNTNFLQYHSQNQLVDGNDRTSEKTERGSAENHEKQIEVSPAVKRKHSEDKQQIHNRNSEGESPNNHANNGNKKQRSSTSSESSEPRPNQQDEIELLKVKRKKTSHVTGPSQQIRELYEFLKENQSLDFLIKQKDIEIIEAIGEGGYGKVSRGRYMQYPVAVKDYMKAGRSHKSREQFMKQVHILSDLKHPNIVLYMGLCITVNRYQLVTEFMENGSLYDQLHIKKTKFTKEQQLEIIDDIVQGMVYLHNMKNMLHRDLKSSNVLIAQDYKVKLCDFGLSGHRSNSKKQKKNRIGTYQWMAPEVIRNEEIDYCSDVYSFGVILWEMLTESIPYSGLSQTQIIGDVGYDKNHRLPNPPKTSDEFIVSMMTKCLNRDSAQRPTFIEIQRLIKQERNNRPVVKDVWNIL